VSDPSRLLDSSGDELERALLQAGSTYAASPELRDKTLAALGLTGAAVTLGAGALVAGSSSKLGISSLLAKVSTAKLAVIAVGAGAALAVPIVMSDPEPSPEPVARAVAALPSPQPGIARAPRAVSEHQAPAASPPSEQAAAPGAPAAAEAPEPTAVGRAPLSSKPLSSAEALRVELAQLDAARSKLASGRSEEALALLDAYDRSAPRGMLKLEAEVLRIDALSRSGRTALAQSRARAFLARHPKSVLAARVRRIAGQ
jgi:hypothetical protein